MSLLSYFITKKHAYVGRRGVQKSQKCVYVIYEWFFEQNPKSDLSYPKKQCVIKTEQSKRNTYEI